MTNDERRMACEMYDGYGLVARSAAVGIDALAAVEAGVPISELAGALIVVSEQLTRIHAVARSMRENYA